MTKLFEHTVPLQLSVSSRHSLSTVCLVWMVLKTSDRIRSIFGGVGQPLYTLWYPRARLRRRPTRQAIRTRRTVPASAHPTTIGTTSLKYRDIYEIKIQILVGKRKSGQKKGEKKHKPVEKCLKIESSLLFKVKNWQFKNV